MSAIANLYNVPSTEAEWLDWSFAHAAHHRDIIRSIYFYTTIRLPEYVLDPINPANVGVWLQQHYLMHLAMDQILGIAGYDLSEVDFTVPSETSGWIFLNADEHKKASDILGIG